MPGKKAKKAGAAANFLIPPPGQESPYTKAPEEQEYRRRDSFHSDGADSVERSSSSFFR